MGYTIQDLPKEERPRERLLRCGSESVSTSELIAILLGSGLKGKSVTALASELVSSFGCLKKLSEATVEELCQIKGIGPAKAIQLKACFTLATSLSQQKNGTKYKVDHPVHAYHLVRDALEREKRELFAILMIDVRGYAIHNEIISIGTLSNALVHPREVFYPAIRHKAMSIVLAHNHPSGDPTPSPQDYEVTVKLVEVGRLIGIQVNDHIIVGENSYVSMRQEGLLGNVFV